MPLTEVLTDSGNVLRAHVGASGAMTQVAEFTPSGLAAPVASHTTRVESPAMVAGNADAAVTARTGGTVRAPDVATGGAGDVAGADLTLRPGKGTGTGTPGTIILQAAPTAGAGDNIQVPATVATVSTAALVMANSTTLNASGGKLLIPEKTPANAAATGTKGELCYDASFLYVCSATNTWLKVAIATW